MHGEQAGVSILRNVTVDACVSIVAQSQGLLDEAGGMPVNCSGRVVEIAGLV